VPSNVQKVPFQRYINRFGQKKVLEYIQRTGKSLPCHVVAVSGSIVTVAFDVANPPFTLPQVTMPMFGPEWVRYPTQVGDLGITVSADTYIGGISALGGGVADLTLRANLSALVWLPIASKDWSPTDDPDAVVIYGPNGGILRTRDKNHTLTVNADGIVLVSTVKVSVSAPQVQVEGSTEVDVSAPTIKVHATTDLELGANGTGFIINGTAGTINTYSSGGTGHPPNPPGPP